MGKQLEWLNHACTMPVHVLWKQVLILSTRRQQPTHCIHSIQSHVPKKPSHVLHVKSPKCNGEDICPLHTCLHVWSGVWVYKHTTEYPFLAIRQCGWYSKKLEWTLKEHCEFNWCLTNHRIYSLKYSTRMPFQLYNCVYTVCTWHTPLATPIRLDN